MNICFVGSGKVATSFGFYLKQKGYNIVGYYSKTTESAKKAANITETTSYENLQHIIGLSDIIFITTNDDAIESVVNNICDENMLRKDQIIVHMSGSLSSNVLKRAKDFGCFVYSMHPLQSFADIEGSINKLKSTVFTIEGCDEKIEVIESILKNTGNKYFRIDSQLKSIYHAGACVVSNYLVTLMDFGLSFFEKSGINREDAFEAVYPLISGTLENIRNLGCEKGITGPIARGDINTVKKHLTSIEENIPERLDFYRIMALRTVDISSRYALKDSEKVQILKNILKEEK
ncbi:Rossmann-like and DUF2520 domain-containing protein [Alkalithermobacter paradoxus]|uniref:Arogenate dehydrogenase n=1 Tax=Alkalithermobacter paradoxus TaxID=29349 RepID=A0A1V4I8G1_9FIRM|nr:arogenate dehydrogenase [[Clostridium] thermoalcaliphilum]